MSASNTLPVQASLPDGYVPQAQDHSDPKLKRRNAVLIALTIILSTAYMASVLKRGWYPHDEGTLAQSAETVLAGEIPHKDFDELYTGGLTYLNAAAFELFGVNLASPRYVSFAIFLAWVPTTLYLASQFTSVPVACFVTLMAVAFGYPNYSAAMPSWYNLFLATFGLAALFFYINTQKLRWLLLAGILGGASLLIKVSGLFFISAALLLLLYRSQQVPGTVLNQRGAGRVYQVFVHLCLLCYVAGLLVLLRLDWNVVTFGYFLIPGVAIAALISVATLRRCEPDGSRFFGLFQEVSSFVLGVLLAVLPFVAFYARHNALDALYRGLFILPQRRFAHQAALTPAALAFLVGLAVDLMLVCCVVLPYSANVRRLRIVSIGVIAAIVVLCMNSYPAQETMWRILWSLLPVVILGGVVLLLWKRSPGLAEADARQKLFAVLAVATGCSLIQYPYFGHVYFCYVAPLVILSCAAVLSFLRNPPRLFLVSFGLCAAFYMSFVVPPGFLNSKGSRYNPDFHLRELKLARAGGLRVATVSVKTYESLVQVIVNHARGNFIYASPDCPEVYFLSGFHNPTRTLFDFFDEPYNRTSRVLDLIRTKQVNLVVLNRIPEFSDRVPEDLESALDKEFPEHQYVGRFEVRWKP